MCSNKKMELKEAFDIVFNTEKFNNARNCIQDNKAEASHVLIERLKYAISNVGNEPENNIRVVLSLIAELEVKEAFPHLIKVLEFKDKNIFLGIKDISPIFFMSLFSKVVSDEKDIAILNEYITNPNILGVNKLVAYGAINDFYKSNNRSKDLELFYKDIICKFTDNNFDYLGDHALLVNIVDSSIDKNFTNTLKDIRVLLIKLIIESERGYNFSGFKDYFKFLYMIDPLIVGKIHNVEEYINNLKNCIDKEIFQYDELIDIGKFLFSKVLGSVKTANSQIIKIAIKRLNYYPYNKRTTPCTDDQYYKEVCDYLGITQIPKLKYNYAKKLFLDIFRMEYSSLKQRIQDLIEETKKQQKKIEVESNEIIAESNGNHSVQKNIKENISTIVENHFREKELKALYKDDNSNESGLLVFYRNEIERFFSSFCEDINNEEKVDEKLREISIRCSGSRFRFEDRIDDMFAPYKKAIKQFNFLIDETPRLTLYNIFYKVKFLPFAEKIKLKHKQKINMKDNDNYKRVKNELEEETEKHPLNPRLLSDCYKNDISKYCRLLEHYSPEIISDVKECISNSICLSKRKSLIEHCLVQIESSNYELAINLLPVQIEGLFADLLEYSTIFECIDDIKQYRTILNLELVKKIGFGIDKNINISFDTIAYFKYYFNSIVRNTVAHGNYDLLVKNRRINKGFYDEDGRRDVNKKIIMLELLFDLNYLVYIISKINEIDTANKYINDVYECYSSLVKEDDTNVFYDCMISDLNGTRERFNISEYKSGIIITYEPMQLLYWIFNPYYEEYLNLESLRLIREILCSFDFWKYVEKELPNHEIKKEKFQSVIKRMFQLDIEGKVKKLLGEVNKQLNTLD